MPNLSFDPARNPRVPRYHIELVRETSIDIAKYTRLASSPAAVEIGRKLTATADRELLIVVTLDVKNRIIGANIVSVGSLSSSVAHPREVMKMAVLQNAAAVIVIHNHPSGDPTPSMEDHQFSKRLLDAGKLMGIRVLDSIVLGETEHYSFADAGLMQVA